MVKNADASKFEQKRKAILGKVQVYRRRFEYSIFISFLFILLGYTKNAIQTNDWTEVEKFFILSNRVINVVILNILPVSIIFAIVSLSLTYVFHPRFMKLMSTIVAFVTLALNFAISESVSGKYLFYLSLFVSEYFIYISLTIVSLFVVLLMFSKFRSWLIQTSRYVFELMILSSVLYFGSMYKTFDIVEALKDYYSVFQHSVSYLDIFTNVSIVWYIFLVFTLILVSTFRGINFHAGRKLETRLNLNILNDGQLPNIGVCVPVCDKSNSIFTTINSILDSNYPTEKMEVLIVANDSFDKTVGVVANRYHMVKMSMNCIKPSFSKIKTKKIKEVWQSVTNPNLKMIVKANGSKFDTLNVGLKYLSAGIKYMSVIDTDTTVNSESFRLLATEFSKSESSVVLTGAVLPKEDYKWYQFKKIAFTQWQYFNHLSCYHVSRATSSFGLFNRYSLLSIGGYKESLGEDIYLTLELQKQKASAIKYIPEAVAYIDASTTVDTIKKQRIGFMGFVRALNYFKEMWTKDKKMAMSFLEFFAIEWITPLLAPFAFAVIIGKPESIYNPLFQIAIVFSIVIPMIQGILGLIIEASYRKVKWYKFFMLPVQLVMFPFIILWRNDIFIDSSSRVLKK